MKNLVNIFTIGWLTTPCPLGYKINFVTKRGDSLIDLIIQSLSTVTRKIECLMDYRTINFLDFILPKFLGNNLLSNFQRTLSNIIIIQESY